MSPVQKIQQAIDEARANGQIDFANSLQQKLDVYNAMAEEAETEFLERQRKERQMRGF